MLTFAYLESEASSRSSRWHQTKIVWMFWQRRLDHPESLCTRGICYLDWVASLRGSVVENLWRICGSSLLLVPAAATRSAAAAVNSTSRFSLQLTTFCAAQTFVINFFKILTSQGVIKSPTSLPILLLNYWEIESLFEDRIVPSTYFHIKRNIFSLSTTPQISNHTEI